MLLKFLDSLVQPVIPYGFFQPAMEVADDANKAFDLLQLLPQAHQQVFEYIRTLIWLFLAFERSCASPSGSSQGEQRRSVSATDFGKHTWKEWSPPRLLWQGHGRALAHQPGLHRLPKKRTLCQGRSQQQSKLPRFILARTTDTRPPPPIPWYSSSVCKGPPEAAAALQPHVQESRSVRRHGWPPHGLCSTLFQAPKRLFDGAFVATFTDRIACAQGVKSFHPARRHAHTA